MSSILRLIPIPLLVAVSFLLILIWFRNGLILGGSEEGLMFYNPGKTLELSKTIWWDYNGGFATLAWLAKIPFLIPLVFLFEILNIPPYLLQALSFFIIIAVGVIAVYLLAFNLLEKFHLRIPIAFFSAIFYVFNPFSISQIWSRGLYAQYSSFALLPLATVLFLVGLTRRKIIYAIYLAFASVIFSGAFGILSFAITYWITLSTCFIYWIFLQKKSGKNILFGLFFYLFSLLLWIILNSWWLLPSIFFGNSIYAEKFTGSEENLGILLGVSKNFTPDLVIRLLQKTFFFDYPTFSSTYSSFIFQLISYLIPLFLIIGLIIIFIKKELNRLKFIVILFILGLVVSLGANPPFGFLFVLFFKQFPFLQSFRNPYEKFGLVYALTYSIIFAVGLVYLFAERIKIAMIKSIGLFFVPFLILGVYAYPMWNGQVVSFPNTTPGIDVPKYYRDLNEWLNTESVDNQRVFMTPIWAVEGTFYLWNKTIYQGIDPTIYILDTPAVSSSPRFPYFYDFIQNIRKYMERINMSGAVSLLRAKYLVAREDAFMITEMEKQHEKYLTSFIYPPQKSVSNKLASCQNQTVEVKKTGMAWLVCRLSPNETDWSKIRYLHVTVSTPIPATVEVALTDANGTRTRWDGRVDPEYSTDNKENTLIIPLGSPTEYNPKIDFSKISTVEILAHPQNFPKLSVEKISLQDIKLDLGEEQPISDFHLIETFGNLKVYEPFEFNPPKEFGVILSLDQIKDFKELFEKAYQDKEKLNEQAYLLLSQNLDKSIKNLPAFLKVNEFEQEKISDLKYWINLKSEEDTFIILSQNYHPEWKILKNVSKEQLAGGLFNNLELLKKRKLEEENHFVVNGYANLWRVDGKDSQYAIVFMPQIIADISWNLSALGVLFLFGATSVWTIRKYISSH